MLKIQHIGDITNYVNFGSYYTCTKWADSCVLLHPLQWRNNERDGVSNHQPHDYLLKRLFRPRSKKTSKLRVTGFCEGNSPVTSEFPAQRASNAENVSIPSHFSWGGGGGDSNLPLSGLHIRAMVCLLCFAVFLSRLILGWIPPTIYPIKYARYGPFY